MKRLLNIILFGLLANITWAQSGADYDPQNPADPDVYYKLAVDASPRAGGRVESYNKNPQLTAGQYCEVYAEPRLGYEFKQWMVGDSVVSTNQYYYFEMPDQDVTLIAYFEWNPVYDPQSPPDPDAAGYSHKVRLYATPSAGGDFNTANFTLVEGQTEYIYAYPSNGYKFVAWMFEGKEISTENPLNIKMGTTDVTYVAKFTYDPESPDDPYANMFDPETGDLVIDNFRPGYLNRAIYNAVGDNYSSVQSITIIGKIQSYDFGFAREFQNCAVLDLSRTTGYNEVPQWSFECMESLTKVILPASIERIGHYAFYECNHLTEVDCYAPTPPIISSYSFEGIDNLIIKVPAASLPLYQDANVWSDYTILPFDEETCNMTINLPQDAADGHYKNMFIEMQNIFTGQSFRYLITDRVSYTFSNLIVNTSYNISIKNAAGAELGRKENVTLNEEDLTVTFDALLQPKSLTAKVVTPDGADVTAQTAITWYGPDGTPIKQGATIDGILEGTTVKYRVTLPSALAMQYFIPDDVEFTVQSTGNEIACNLQAFQAVSLSGRILDLTTNQPVAGATVTISQELNGKYTKSTTLLCGKDGKFTASAFNAPSSVTFSASNYLSKTLDFDNLDNNQQIGDVTLKAITGAVISLGFTYTASVEDGQTAQTQDGYADAANITYSLFNQTQNQPINDFNVQNGEIVLLEEVDEGDIITLTAYSRKGLFNDVTATTTAIDDKNRATVTIPIVSLGGIKATFTQNQNKKVVGILYDSNGVLLSKSSFDASNTLAINDLADGNYTLVTMGSSKFFNSVLNISELTKAGLTEGTDFARNAISVNSGIITVVNIGAVPTFNDTQFYYTGVNTSFTVNKPTVVVGNYLTLTGRLDFKPDYPGIEIDSIKNVQIIVDLPQNCSFVDNSVIVGNTVNAYTLNGNQVTIPLANYSELMRFCVIPTKGGTYAPSAFVKFTVYGDTITQPIGSATYTAQDLTINVPSVVAKPTIPISGTATGKSTIDIYDNGVLIAQTTSLANGHWATTCELYDTTNLSQHQIYAKVTTKTNVKMQSETKIVTYDKDAIMVSKVTMYYTNPEVNGWRGQNYVIPFDFENPSRTAYKYVYYIYDRHFNFTIEFNTDDPTKVTEVILNVKTGDGNWTQLIPVFDSRTGKWMVAAEFGDMYDGIVPVNVSVTYVVKVIRNTQNSGNPDTDVSIDPSGYVYEAVSSNRLQGVTTTVYYKETTEDMYGILHQQPVLWDAEEYAQENPLFTDENGMYRWDVPQGEWQVKFEKDGYETTYSEWLPVPPPQLEVNVGMTQIRQPEVKQARAYTDGIDIEFDKYMLPALLNTDNILVTQNNQSVQGSIKMLNEEVAYENSSTKYVSKIRFVPTTPFTANEVTLTISNQVKSYAGIQMQDNYQQTFDIEQEITAIKADSAVAIAYGSGQKINISVLPGSAAAGKTLKISSSSTAIASLLAESCVLDAEGKASFTVSAELPGSATLTYSIDGYDITSKTIVNIEMKNDIATCATPTSSIVSGSTVDKGTTLQLLCATENATIYYTIDGSNPHGNTQSAIEYNGNPIVINDTVIIKVIAIAPDMYESEMAQFEYNVKATKLPAKNPTASIASGTAVNKGTTLQLSCETGGATIYYTTDGSNPSVSVTRKQYSGTPIVINEDVVIKAISIAPDMLESEIVMFEYTIKSTTNIDDISADKNNIKLYPLPMRDVLNISAEGKIIRNVSIVALSGATVLSQEAASSEVTIDVDSLAAGIYVIVIRTDDGNYSHKIVKSK